ncbi:SusC/RagA family TonB-linked outer membrane protein [Daejeonella oryzae]|uniref:SusC/RagA family TonB-linked outer membrane protein n=1 Tax=Daejeonella oryzae TaxID=1122943 RepID=UPI00047DEC48|nr:TonB-dependent receptor [Daejeonella oryzae]
MKRMITLVLFIYCALFSPVFSQVQEFQVSGKVTSKSDGLPLPGVTVTVMGTTTGTSTDEAGKFSIRVPKAGSVLEFKQLGMETQTFTVNNSNSINISLLESSSALQEVVVVGYGTQKKSVVTGAISGVDSKDIENQQISRVEQALQGRASGLTVASSSGAPGASATVRVRGTTTLGNSDPLYVVDGVVVDVGGIDYLNQNDIESIQVLKDAASAAIYGARAASGVILVTTKKGKSGSMNINYAAYYGTQSPVRRLDMLNATEYATLRNEASVAGGGGIVYADPQSYGEGTNWQDALFNDNAKIQNHEISLSGGNEKSTYYTSFGYFDQQGIIASDISNYNRYNIRLNSAHKIKDWLNVGQNVGYSHIKSQGGLGTNTEFGGPLSSVINLDPITPIVITDPAVAGASPYSTQRVVRDANGNPYGISQAVGQEMTNPFAYIQTQLGNYGWSDNIVGNVYAEVEPIKGLKFRSTVGAKLAYWGGESFRPLYYLNPAQQSSQTAFNRDRNQAFNWNLENTASYTQTIDKHNFTVLAGQGAYRDNNSSGVYLSFSNIAANSFDEASFNLKVPTANRTSDAYEGINHTVSSLFGRVIYDYGEKYLFTGIIRRDGSSRFGSNNKYGYFPSASVGWVPSREDFWVENNVVNTLKIRGSYGIVGNDNLGDFRYISTVGANRNYVFGYDNYYIGYSPDAPANPDLKWEETSQLNIGLDAILFQNFNFTFDWYNKKTSGILQTIALPGYVGSTGSPWGNVADMENRGLEFELGYQKQLGKLNLNVRSNLSFLQNEVTYLGEGKSFLDGGANIQNSAYPITRIAVGEAIGSFYGFQSNGIFQNQAEINAYTGANGLIQPNAKPGDFRWSDINSDGKIDQADRTFIGDPTPNITYGFTMNANWKNLDLLVFGQGVSGNQIFQGLRRLDIPNANWQSKALNRWSGEGSSNTYPRLTTNDENRNFSNPSDFFLEDGAYFRIKTLQLGYTLPSSLTSKAGLSKARIYVSSNNLVTFTKYTGFDPEIGTGGSYGIDRGIYPQSRSFLFGLNVGL